MKTNQVITIAREYGSGGRTIGKMIAEELGWNFYDREILRLASDESGIGESYFARVDEVPKRAPLFHNVGNVFDGKVIPPESDGFISNENLFRYQAKIIRNLAETENCVIIGRCANYILKDETNVLRIYVHAPWEVCIRAVMRRDGLMQDEAIKRIKNIDKQRGEYYKNFTGADWKNADNYDLCLDSSRLGYEKCISLVKSYLENMKP